MLEVSSHWSGTCPWSWSSTWSVSLASCWNPGSQDKMCAVVQASCMINHYFHVSMYIEKVQRQQIYPKFTCLVKRSVACLKTTQFCFSLNNQKLHHQFWCTRPMNSMQKKATLPYSCNFSLFRGLGFQVRNLGVCKKLHHYSYLKKCSGLLHNCSDWKKLP